MQNMTVKQLKNTVENQIEVYIPSDKINCVNVKFQNRDYQPSTNADDRIIEFIQTTNNDELETIIQVYTK